MFKLLLILLIGLFFEATGVVLLKKGIDSIGEMKTISIAEVLRVVKAGVTSPFILLGIFFEACFFVALLALMSKSDISFLWPLTGLSFVVTTFAALMFLGEKVSAVRWTGVLFIVIGAGFISYSEHSKDRQPTSTQAPPSPSALPPQP